MAINNPNPQNITVNATVVCDSANAVFCQRIGFVGEFPGGISWEVPAGSSTSTGKTFIKVNVKIPEGFEQRKYNAAIVFSGPGLIANTVPVEFVPSTSLSFLSGEISRVNIGQVSIPVTGVGLVLFSGLAVGGYAISRPKKGVKRG